MYLNVGNDHAKEGYRDETSEDPDKVHYRELEGERVTTLVFPEGMSLSDAFSAATAALSHHMTEGSAPAWIESDSEGLTTLLTEHYGLTKSKASRPKSWGKDTGVDDLPLPGEDNS